MSLTISGLVATVLALVFSPEETDTIVSFLDQGVLVGGILLTYWGRYRQGDINFFGMKK